jgi:hypothetical protein
VRAPDEYEQRPIVDTKTDGKWIQRESTPEEIMRPKLTCDSDAGWMPDEWRDPITGPLPSSRQIPCSNCGSPLIYPHTCHNPGRTVTGADESACPEPACDYGGVTRRPDPGMGGDCQRQRDIRCSGCHQPFGSQHRPSCHRQGMVTSASDYDYMGAWIQPESGYDQRWCSFTDQMANLASGRAAGPGGRERPADGGTGHSASQGAKLPYSGATVHSGGKAERP